MRFELVELYLENSLFLLKAQLCNGGINAHNQQGSRRYSHRRAGRERRSRILGNICILFPFVFTYSRAFALKVCAKCPGGPGCGECALLLPRVYLQTVTLMQCNDYFYSRYLGSLFAPSGMAPHWPTDYLCGCRHTWRLQPSSLSLSLPTPMHLEDLPAFITAPSFLHPPLDRRTFTFLRFPAP